MAIPIGGASILVLWVDPYFGRDHIPYNTGLHLSELSATIVHCTIYSLSSPHRLNALRWLRNVLPIRSYLFRYSGSLAAICHLLPYGAVYPAINKTRLRSQVEGSRTSGRIRNIPFDFGVFFAISQNILILVSHVLQNLMKKLKFSPFGKIEKCQIWVKYEK